MSRTARTVLALIRVYKIVLSPLFAGNCRYLPGCADYMTEAITRHGVIRGGWLGTRRLCRCHPFGGHGYDPVPQSLDHRIDHQSPDHQFTRSITRSRDQEITRWNVES